MVPQTLVSHNLIFLFSGSGSGRRKKKHVLFQSCQCHWMYYFFLYFFYIIYEVICYLLKTLRTACALHYTSLHHTKYPVFHFTL